MQRRLLFCASRGIGCTLLKNPLLALLPLLHPLLPLRLPPLPALLQGTWPTGIQAPLMDVGDFECLDYVYIWTAPGYNVE